MNKLTTIILAKNEERSIERALKSASFSDEILVIDDQSSDNTAHIVKKHNATLLFRELNADFASQRNYAMQQATHDWILYLDADEEVSVELFEALKHLLHSSNSYDAYYIKRRDFFWNKEMKYGELRKVRKLGLIRLIKKGSGLWKDPVHEVFVPHASHKTDKLEGFINHFSHSSLTYFIKDINNYSSLRASQLYKKNVKPNIFKLCFMPFGKFILTYFVYFGFLDGATGFVYAFLMSFHSFLVQAKLFQFDLSHSSHV